MVSGEWLPCNFPGWPERGVHAKLDYGGNASSWGVALTVCSSEQS